MHGGDLRYCHVWGAWLTWDGRRWKQDETGEEMRRAKATVRAMRAEAIAMPQGDARRKRLLRHARACEAASRIAAMARLAQSDDRVVVTPDQLDADPWLLNVENGVLDLRTGALCSHRREDFITKLAPVRYDPTALCPHWTAFLDSIFAGDSDLVRFVQRAVGYSLTGDARERVIFILHGGGANGKSTLLEVLLALLGRDYALKARSQMLVAKKENAIPHEIAELKGRRFVAASEVDEGKKLAEAAIKEMTGDDTLRGRFLYQESFSFRAEHKLWLGTNHKPVIRGSDDAIWDRIKPIPFNVRFVDPADPAAPIDGPRQDKGLRAKLLSELPGILRWALDGCLHWQRDGLGVVPAVAQANAAYRDEMDHVKDFIAERCACGPELSALTGDLYHNYNDWCRRLHERPLTLQAFTKRLDPLGFPARKINGQRARSGIALRGATNVQFAS
jgi:putative DNA primase/helicase